MCKRLVNNYGRGVYCTYMEEEKNNTQLEQTAETEPSQQPQQNENHQPESPAEVQGEPSPTITPEAAVPSAPQATIAPQEPVPSPFPAVQSQGDSVLEQGPSRTSDSVTAIRALLIKLLLGSVVTAAVVAVVAILLGDFGETAWRAIGTIISAIIHIGILFAVISTSTSNDPRTERSANVVINVAMAIAVLSFFTSVFAVWDVMGATLSSKLIVTYAVVLFAIVHAKALMDMAVIYDKIKPYAIANYVAIGTVVTLILGIIYLPSELQLLSTFYGRLLAATVVIDVTLGIIIAVMQKLYIQKHPELQEASSRAAGVFGIIRLIVALLLFFFIVLPLVMFAIAFAR